MRRMVALLVAAGLVLAACGGASTNPSSVSPTVSATTAPPAPTLPTPTATAPATNPPTEAPIPTAEVTPVPEPVPTDPPVAVLSGITNGTVVAAATGVGLECQTDQFGVTCDLITDLGTDLGVASTGIDSGLEEVDITATGDAAEGYTFITRMARALLGRQGSAVASWVGSHENATVVEKTFGPYYIVYRGPLDVGYLQVQPPP